MYASRNIKLCTKDCLCLFVCPTGATDTESGQIDKDRCIRGCRVCVDACPSHAISLVPEEYPQLPPKDPALTDSMIALMERKSEEEGMARGLETSESPVLQKLARAMMKSCRILGEDCARESGYMMPQSEKTEELLKSLGLENPLAK